MRIDELFSKLNIITEMPISNWTVDKDFDSNRETMLANRSEWRDELEHYEDSDIQGIKNPHNVERVINYFKKCPYNFNIYFVHSTQPDYDDFLQIGLVDERWLLKHFGQDIAKRVLSTVSPDSITILITNNMSDENKINLNSPWAIGHRIGHAIIGGRNSKAHDIFESVEKFIKNIVKFAYSVKWPKNDESSFYHMQNDEYLMIYGLLLGHSLGTMNSARKKKLVQYPEWIYETFVQYLIFGKITLNPLPSQIDAEEVLTNDPKKLDKVTKIWDKFPKSTEKHFAKLLNNAKGKIFVI